MPVKRKSQNLAVFSSTRPYLVVSLPQDSSRFVLYSSPLFVLNSFLPILYEIFSAPLRPLFLLPPWLRLISELARTLLPFFSFHGSKTLSPWHSQCRKSFRFAFSRRPATSFRSRRIEKTRHHYDHRSAPRISFPTRAGTPSRGNSRHAFPFHSCWGFLYSYFPATRRIFLSRPRSSASKNFRPLRIWRRPHRRFHCLLPHRLRALDLRSSFIGNARLWIQPPLASLHGLLRPHSSRTAPHRCCPEIRFRRLIVVASKSFLIIWS
jgi:hypothetical protein